MRIRTWLRELLRSYSASESETSRLSARPTWVPSSQSNTAGSASKSVLEQPALQQTIAALGLTTCSVCGTLQSPRRKQDGTPMPDVWTVHFATVRDTKPCPGSWPRAK